MQNEKILTEPEKKVIRLLCKINKIYEKEDVSIKLFANNGSMIMVKDINGDDKNIYDDLSCIRCEGGDDYFERYDCDD